jgi:hypothetical protein
MVLQPCGRPGDYKVEGYRPGAAVPLCAEHAAICTGEYLIDVFKHGRRLSIALLSTPAVCVGIGLKQERL